MHHKIKSMKRNEKFFYFGLFDFFSLSSSQKSSSTLQSNFSVQTQYQLPRMRTRPIGSREIKAFFPWKPVMVTVKQHHSCNSQEFLHFVTWHPAKKIKNGVVQFFTAIEKLASITQYIWPYKYVPRRKNGLRGWWFLMVTELFTCKSEALNWHRHRETSSH